LNHFTFVKNQRNQILTNRTGFLKTLGIPFTLKAALLETFLYNFWLKQESFKNKFFKEFLEWVLDFFRGQNLILRKK